MTRHTPGPWSYNSTPDSKECDFAVYGAMVHDPAMGELTSQTVVKIQTTWTLDKAEAEANARLIAASLDLLEACKAMLGLEGYDKTIGELMAIQAIAKAEGK